MKQNQPRASPCFQAWRQWRMVTATRLWSGNIMLVSEYRVGSEKGGRSFVYWGEEQIWKDEECADMDDLLATWNHSQASAATKDHVLVHGPDAAMGGLCWADPAARGTGELVLCVWENRASLSLSLMCHTVIRLREIFLPPPATWAGKESWPQGLKNRKAGSALHRLQQSGEWTLHLPWAQE